MALAGFLSAAFGAAAFAVVPAQQPSLGKCPVGLAVDQSQPRGGDPGPPDLLVVGVARLESGQQPVPGMVGEVLGAAAQQPANPEQRIVAAAAVTEGQLMDPVAHLVHRGQAEAK